VNYYGFDLSQAGSIYYYEPQVTFFILPIIFPGDVSL